MHFMADMLQHKLTHEDELVTIERADLIVSNYCAPAYLRLDFIVLVALLQLPARPSVAWTCSTKLLVSFLSLLIRLFVFILVICMYLFPKCNKSSIKLNWRL